MSMMGGKGGAYMGAMKSAMAAMHKQAAGGELTNRMQGHMYMGRAGMYGNMGKVSEAELRKNMRTLVRTDFLLQFVYVPVKPETLPKDEAGLKLMLDAEAAKLAEAEKDYEDVSGAPTRMEEAIEAQSLKKSQEIDSAMTKALDTVPAGAPGASGAPGAAAVPGTPGFGAPAAGAPPAAPPATPKGAPGPSN